jgi:hypothetical protein
VNGRTSYIVIISISLLHSKDQKNPHNIQALPKLFLRVSPNVLIVREIVFHWDLLRVFVGHILGYPLPPCHPATLKVTKNNPYKQAFP